MNDRLLGYAWSQVPQNKPISMGTSKKVAVGGRIPSVAGRKPQYGDGLPLGLSMKEMAHGYRQDLSGRNPAPAEEYVAGDRHGITLRHGKSEQFQTCLGMRRSVGFLSIDP